jgi:mevalonate kinase
MDLLSLALRLLLAPPPFSLPWDVRVESSIPLGSGLGSSAAFSVALLRSLGGALGRSIPSSELNDLAFDLEKEIHKTPSGIDNTVISYDRPIWFCKEQPVEFLTPKGPIHLILAAGQKPRHTREALTRVRTFKEENPDRFSRLHREAERITEDGRRAFLEGKIETLGPLLDHAHELLQEIGVSTAGLDAMAGAARRAASSGGLRRQADRRWNGWLHHGPAPWPRSRGSGPRGPNEARRGPPLKLVSLDRS